MKILASSVFFVVALGVACSSASKGSALDDACTAYLQATAAYEAQCDEVVPSVDQSRAVQACALLAGAPGETGMQAALAACTAATKSGVSTCTLGTACTQPAPGALAVGAACGVNEQCASAWCQGARIARSQLALAADTNSIFPTSFSCGVCADALPVGSPCTLGDLCVAGAACATSTSDGGATTSTCAAVTESDVGGSCAAPAICKIGIHCNAATATCVSTFGAAGDLCAYDGDCASPLRCTSNDPSGTTRGTCVQGTAAGSGCTAESGCARGLACARDSTCVAVTFGAPGAPCDEYATLCATGACNLSAGSAGACPTVVSDGQPCGPLMTSAVCANTAYCIGGVCQQFDPSTCK